MDTIKLRFKDRAEYAKVFQQLKDRVYEEKNWQRMVAQAIAQVDDRFDDVVDEAIEHYERNEWDFDEKTERIVIDCLVSVAHHQWTQRAISDIADQMLEDGLEAISELQNNNIIRN